MHPPIKPMHNSTPFLSINQSIKCGHVIIVYESSRAVNEYLLFHFGSSKDLFPYEGEFGGPREALNFPVRTANIVASLDCTKGRVLDVGCAVGGSSFAFTKSFNEVIGIDYSQHFIDAANNLKTNKVADYDIQKQGKIFVNRQAILPSDIDTSKVSFQQGDACNLDVNLGTFDVIHASNLLCRLPQPRKFIDNIPNFLNPNGYLVLISPYSWLEEYTELNEWFGAGSQQGNDSDSFSELQKYIGSKLTLTHQENIPFLIREHERKFQYGVSHVTIWKKSS